MGEQRRPLHAGCAPPKGGAVCAATKLSGSLDGLGSTRSRVGADLALSHTSRAKPPSPRRPRRRPAPPKLPTNTHWLVSHDIDQTPALRLGAGSANQTSPFDLYSQLPIRTTSTLLLDTAPARAHTSKKNPAPDHDSPANRSLVVLTSRPVSTPSSSSRASMASRTRRRSGGSPSFCPRSVVPLVSSSSSTRRTRSVSLRETP